VSETCRTCGERIEWGWINDKGKWVPLEPIETHDDLPRTFVDENDVLRADHRDRHRRGASGVNITRLDKKIPATIAKEHAGAIARIRRRRTKDQGA
jgi:hypothetical protein